jgi:NAD(P)-dependent dehydrogenase (short-subunit alcohol dehydrogenase family)
MARIFITGSLITAPHRLVYLSSGMHRGGDAALDDPQWARRPWNGARAYSDSKLFDVALAFAVARRWPTVLSNSLEPGWVATKMGGPAARVTGSCFYHQRPLAVHPAAHDPAFQDRLLDYCASLTGIALPTPSSRSPARY